MRVHIHIYDYVLYVHEYLQVLKKLFQAPTDKLTNLKSYSTVVIGPSARIRVHINQPVTIRLNLNCIVYDLRFSRR
jgi:hypothetical protein